MSNFLRQSVRRFDYLIASTYLGLFRERPGLLTFLFHGIFDDEAEIARNLVDPQQRITLALFREFLEYFKRCGYAFVGPDDLLKGLDPRGRHVLITFDDGYRSSFRALPLLREYAAPAAFFISTDQVRQNRCFWWDVYYREQAARGLSEQDMAGERKRLKSLEAAALERCLVEQFGADAFTPRGEVDRPVTPAELKAFAADPLVHIGNHTASHAILPNHTAAEIRRQIREAQRALTELTGAAPVFIAYPNGNSSEEVVKISREEGLKLGITTTPGKNRVPLPPMTLRRELLTAGPDFNAQCALSRSDLSVYRLLVNARNSY